MEMVHYGDLTKATLLVKDKGTTLTKSMLASKNLPKPITNASEGYHWIRVLAAELALRLNDARQISPNLWPKTLVLHARKGICNYLPFDEISFVSILKQYLGYEAGRSKQAPFPFTKEVTVDYIASAGGKLWKELVGNASTMRVSSVQLAFTGIDVSESGQKTIEGFLRSKPTSKRPREEEEEPFERDGALTGASGAATPKDDDERIRVEQVDQAHETPKTSRSGASYTCPRCQKTLRPTPSATLAFQNAEDRASVIAALRLEHDDWHFAQDLARGESPAPNGGKRIVPGPGQPQAQGSKAKKRKKETTGIEKFFMRK